MSTVKPKCKICSRPVRWDRNNRRWYATCLRPACVKARKQKCSTQFFRKVPAEYSKHEIDTAISAHPLAGHGGHGRGR